MTPFFSIEFKHRIDGRRTAHLALRLAAAQQRLVRNSRFLFRQSPGYLNCLIEDDESIVSELDHLLFWVICTHDEFYQYTDLPAAMVFNGPILLWHNAGSSEGLIASSTPEELTEANILKSVLLHKHQDQSLIDLAGAMPANVIGLIAIDIRKIKKGVAYIYKFNAKKTYWRYHIHPRKPQDTWNYTIVDTMSKWKFDQIEEEAGDWISFQSTDPIAYQDKASDRLQLQWGPIGENRFEEPQHLTLPFADYAHRIIDGDEKETTPIYIHI